MKNKIFTLILLSQFTLLFPKIVNAQCNVQASICTPGVAGPFNFQSGGHNAFNSSCLDQFSYSQYAFIVLYITQSGNLNMLVNGNGSSGFLDVAVFNVPQGVAPCTAIQSTSNQIMCNYASASNGCNQFGTQFGCSSNVPSVAVTAGQTIMIVVEDWENGPSTTFTLQLAPPPSAQTGPPDATINPAGPFCATDGLMQLTAVNNGGTWTGPGVSPTGMFNPAAAGVGTHTINYSIGISPCNSSASTQITVGSIAMSGVNVGTCQPGGGYQVTGNVSVQNPPPTGQLIVRNCEGQETVVASAPFAVGTIPFNLSGLNANGGNCNLHAYFTDSSCSHILNYTAPICEDCTISSIGVNIGDCQTDGTYGVSGAIQFVNQPLTGSLIVTTTCGGSQVFTAPFTSPINYSISGLPANGATCNVRAYFTAEPACELIQSYTAPNEITPTFNPIGVCHNETPPSLPSTSLNGINGTWSPATINTSTIGTTNYTFTPNLGECAESISFPITIHELPDAQVSNPSVLYECLVNPTVQLTGSSSTPGVTYQWTGNSIVSGQTTTSPVVNATGVYTMTVTNPATGCVNSATITVVGDGNEPDISISNPGVISCDNPTIILNATSTTPGITSSWTGTGIVSGANTLTPTVDEAGVYQVTVQSTNGCTNAASVTVTGNTNLPDINSSPSSFVISCPTPTVVINGSSTVSGVTYSWQNIAAGGTAGIVSGQNTGMITVNAAGNYSVTVTNPANNCTNTATFTVTGNTNLPDAVINNTPQINCLNPTVQLNGASSTTGTTASWTGPGIVSGGNTFTPSVNQPGTYVLTVTNPSNSCTNTASVTIDQVVPVTPSIFPNTTICGSFIEIPSGAITANGNVVWTEANGNGTFSNPTSLTPTFTATNGVTEYLLTFTDECGYSRSARLIMETPHQINSPAVSCNMAEFNITTQSYAGGIWSVVENPGTPYVEDTTLTFIYGDTLAGGATNTAVSVSHHGTYTLYFTSNGTCPDTSITLNFPPYLWAQINDTVLCPQVQYELIPDVSPYNMNYSWNTGATSSSILVTQPGEYIVSVSNQCYTYSDTAFIDYQICDVNVPNIISLSSQSGNNIWYVGELGVVTFNCIIVNRWGNLIYEFSDVNGHWNGRDRGGNVVPEGVYFYTIEATFHGGTETVKNGFIHVVH